MKPNFLRILTVSMLVMLAMFTIFSLNACDKNDAAPETSAATEACSTTPSTETEAETETQTETKSETKTDVETQTKIESETETETESESETEIETLAKTEPETETQTESETETQTETESETETETESETAEPLPDTIALPEAYSDPDTTYECGDGSVMYTFNKKTDADFDTVCAYYREQGFKIYSDTVKAGNFFTTFVGNGPMAHVYWLHDNGELNIVISNTASATLPPITPDVTDGEFECSVVQLQDNDHVNGMAYVIQLKDGSYIVYDGSYSSQFRPLQKYLRNNHTGKGAPIIRAWILTHSHDDHYPTFKKVAEMTTPPFIVEHVIYAPMNGEVFELGEELGYFGSDKFKEGISNLGAKAVYAHVGMEFTFCNLKLEVLMSPELVFRNTPIITNSNNTSVVTRLYDENYSALFLGDIAREGTRRMDSMYGDYLQSDMCQVSRHGVENVPLSFYEIIKAPILYYPCNIKLYDQTERHYDVRTALEQRDYTKEILIAGCGEFRRAWGTVFEENAPLVIPNHPTKGPKE